MSASTTVKFVENAPHNDPAFIWDRSRLSAFGGSTVPTDVLGLHDGLLRGDQSVLWLRWFLEGIASPGTYLADPSKTWAHLYDHVLTRIEDTYRDDLDSDRRDLARAIADHLFSEIERRRLAGRKGASKSDRVSLIQSATPPRCYLCGYAFESAAIQKFLGQKGGPAVNLPVTLDVLRPRGRKPHEVCIEVEHVMPVASGGLGGSNLRLACGWCNRAKSAKTSIYDASATARVPSGTLPLVLGGHRQFELPEPFWVVRITAIQGQCQAAGCSATIQNSELRVTLKDFSGSPNPTNLRAVCPRHDPIVSDRLKNRDVVKAWWA